MLPIDSQTISSLYQELGYVVLRDVFSDAELAPIKTVLGRFHEQWLLNNEDSFNSRAVNSAYLTDRKLLNASDRTLLFQLIAGQKVSQLLKAVFPGSAAFMNTQLFFDPRNPQQKNYWHRDIQYSGLALEEQKKAFETSNVIHIRLPILPEPGLELIPQTHRRWDSDFEFSVRMAQEGRAVHDELPGAQRIALAAGDVLVFSANMIHRGLYGGQRMAFDMLFCDPLPALIRYVNPDCLPSSEEMQALSCPEVFEQTRAVLTGL